MKTTALVEVWTSFWDARAPREKMLLTWGGVLLAVLLAYSVLWAPAQEGRSYLRDKLPLMYSEVSRMTAQAEQARVLAAATQGVAPTGRALKDALTASLSEHGFAAGQVQVAGNAVQIELKNVSFPIWTMWLDDVRKQFKVQVSEAHVKALKTDGQVDLSVMLEPATGSRSTQ